MRSDKDVGIVEPNNQPLKSATKDASPQSTTWAHLSKRLTAVASKRANKKGSRYPKKANRYSEYGWNKDHQECYTKQDEKLLQRIQSKYNQFFGKTENNYFDKAEEKHWHDWWVCVRPAYDKMLRKYDSESFTLPNREAKDAKVFPLWDYADNMARQIANWQAERVQNQNIDLMNDPVMLVFEELRDWYFNILSMKEGKKEDLDSLAKRQSYIEHLIQVIPDFGKDRMHLYDIKNSLQDASKVILNTIANKELPQLLTDIVNNSKSLEKTIGTYLHFSLINEPVADNYSPMNQLGPAINKNQICNTSPVCKIYEAAHAKNANPLQADVSNPLQYLQSLNPFYKLSEVKQSNGDQYVHAALNAELASAVKFASFVTEEDKKNYVETLALLEALSNIRQTIEHFHDVQVKVGTYVFAKSYLDQAKALTANYIELVNKIKLSLNKIIKAEDKGYGKLLDPTINMAYKQANQHFQNNHGALYTKAVDGTTINEQLENIASKATGSVETYKQKMERLVSDINSGRAKQDIETAMNDLFIKIKHINKITEVVLGDESVSLKSDMDLPPSYCQTGSSDEICNAEVTTTTNQQNAQTNIPTDSMHQKEELPAFDNNFIPLWDENVKYDPVTNVPIYTLRIYQGDKELGSADFYGQQSLCLSEDGQHHNIIRSTGFLSTLPAPDLKSITETCQYPFPTPSEKIYASAKSAAGYGALRGGSHVIEHAMKVKGMSNEQAHIVAETAYFSCYFLMKYYAYYQMQSLDDEKAIYQAMYQAAFDTVQMWASTFVLGKCGELLTHAGKALEEYDWKWLGGGLKSLGSLAQFGIFAYNAAENGVAETSAALISGTVAEVLTEQTGRYIVNKINN